MERPLCGRYRAENRDPNDPGLDRILRAVLIDGVIGRRSGKLTIRGAVLQADGDTPAANPRHGHEWKIWNEVKLQDGKIIILGVIDSTSSFVEHPELVADRLVQYAKIVAEGARLASRQLW